MGCLPTERFVYPRPTIKSDCPVGRSKTTLVLWSNQNQPPPLSDLGARYEFSRFDNGRGASLKSDDGVYPARDLSSDGVSLLPDVNIHDPAK